MRQSSSKGLITGLVLGVVGLILLLGVGCIGLIVYLTPASGRIAASSRIGSESEWQTFAPANGGFSVLMPGLPDNQSQSMNGVFVSRYEVLHAGSGSMFSVTFLDLNPNALRPNSLEVLTNARRDSLADKSKGRVTAETPITLGGVAGREFQIFAPDAGLLIARVYLVKIGGGHRLYELVAAGPSIVPGQSVAACFFDSFRLDATASPPNLPPDPVPGGP